MKTVFALAVMAVIGLAVAVAPAFSGSCVTTCSGSGYARTCFTNCY